MYNLITYRLPYKINQLTNQSLLTKFTTFRVRIPFLACYKKQGSYISYTNNTHEKTFLLRGRVRIRTHAYAQFGLNARLYYKRRVGQGCTKPKKRKDRALIATTPEETTIQRVGI